MNLLKRLAARLPDRWQHRLRMARSRSLIRHGDFHAGEPEFDRLSEWLQPGDWAVDIGANMGSYSIAMSRLAGENGRVIALEPMPETFSILVSNLQYAKCRNVTTINAAASDRAHIAEMHVPKFDTGLEDFYQARLTAPDAGIPTRAQGVLAITIDSLTLPHRVALVKADVEGHEASVLTGMRQLIERDRPVLLLEASSDLLKIEGYLLGLGYVQSQISGSPNRIYIAEPQ